VVDHAVITIPGNFARCCDFSYGRPGKGGKKGWWRSAITCTSLPARSVVCWNYQRVVEPNEPSPLRCWYPPRVGCRGLKQKAASASLLLAQHLKSYWSSGQGGLINHLFGPEGPVRLAIPSTGGKIVHRGVVAPPW
jgi:hypothetical protein